MTDYLTNDHDWENNRWLMEGCCPICHKPMKRCSLLRAECAACIVVWESKRVPIVFGPKMTGEV